jgi:methionyl-tRNA synthetase
MAILKTGDKIRSIKDGTVLCVVSRDIEEGFLLSRDDFDWRINRPIDGETLFDVWRDAIAEFVSIGRTNSFLVRVNDDYQKIVFGT